MKKIIIIGIVLGCLWNSNLIAQGTAQVPYRMNLEDTQSYWELENWTVENEDPLVPEIINSESRFLDNWPGIDSSEGKSFLMIWSYYGPEGNVRELLTDATLKIDLSGNDDVFLQGAWKAVFHEEGTDNCLSDCGWMNVDCDLADFIDEDNEGIFISDDGGDTYVKIRGFSGFDRWNEFRLNLSLLSSQYGFELNAENRIKFQYYCVYGNAGNPGSIMKYLFIEDISVYKLPGNTGGGNDGYHLNYLYDKAGNRTSVNMDEIDLRSASVAKLDENEPLADDLFGAREIKIYPNPTRGDLNIQIQNGEKEEKYQYLLFDLNGRLLMEFSHSGNGTVPLNLHSFYTGTYILVIRTSDGDLKYKIMKE
jgi:hypothetical protein